MSKILTGKPLMSSSVAFVGIGQAGGNIAYEFYKLGYSAYFINSSATDLLTIDVNKTFKYQIPFAQGCNKNRDKAKSYAKEYYPIIANNIQSKMSNFSHIFFCFSMGGGTGSGITPILINTLAKRSPDITFGIICSIPELTESAKAKHNAVTCYKEIQSITNLGNIYMIDNNNRRLDKMTLPLQQLDETFATKLHSLLSLTSANVKGIADESEILTVISMYGVATIADILPKEMATETSSRVQQCLPFAQTLKGCSYLTYNLSNEDDFVQSEVENVFGKPTDFFKGYSDLPSFVASFGLPFPDHIINSLVDEYKSDIEEIDSTETEIVDIEIGEFVDPLAKRRRNLNIANTVGSFLEDL